MVERRGLWARGSWRPSIPEFVKSARRRELPRDFILVMVGIYTTVRLGLAGSRTTSAALSVNFRTTVL